MATRGRAPRPQSRIGCRTAIRGPRRSHTEVLSDRRDRRRRADRRAVSRSTSTTSTLPSPNSTPGTSPAKRPRTRTRGRSSQASTPRSTERELPRRRRTGSAIDHRRAHTVRRPADLTASSVPSLDLTPDLSIHIEAVHRLSDLGAVVTNTAYGTSPEGFDAEWRMIELLTVEGDRISRCELFDEADLDAALARFDELQPQPPRLENAASQLRRAVPGVLRGPRLGRDGGDYWPTTFSRTIAVGS